MDQAYIVADEHRHGEGQETKTRRLSKVHTATAILKLRLRATLDFGTFPAPLQLLHLVAKRIAQDFS